MKLVGLITTRNGGRRLQLALGQMSRYCDLICAVSDRSSDATAELLRTHPRVSSYCVVDPSVSDEPWHFAESRLLDLLYRMADLHNPDWVVMLDDDERLVPAGMVRTVLAGLGPTVAGLELRRVSVWRDRKFPHLTPIMGTGIGRTRRVWRHYRHLRPGSKPLHNDYMPVDIEAHGARVRSDALTISHSGWSTLEKRIEAVDRYSALDPRCQWNDGVPYDRGLLFGYGRTEIDRLIEDYSLCQLRAPGKLLRVEPTEP